MIHGPPWWLNSKKFACNARITGDAGLIPESGNSPWRMAWQPTQVFLPGESHGQRSLVGYSHSPWGHKDTKSRTWLKWVSMDAGDTYIHIIYIDIHTHTHTHTYIYNFLCYIGVQLINNVVIVSGAQQRDSAIHIHVSILFQTPLPPRLPHNIKQSSLYYIVGPCWLSILNRVPCTCPS